MPKIKVMEPIKIEELIPESVNFKLIKTGKEYKLNVVTLADEAWARRLFGRDIEDIMRNPKSADEIIKITFRLMDEESKKEFCFQKVTFIDDSGKSVEVEIGGADLLVHFVAGGKEIYEVCKSILRCIGISRPLIEKAEAEVLKKKLMMVQSEKIGPSSLTSSPSNMDGPQSTSSVAL